MLISFLQKCKGNPYISILLFLILPFASGGQSLQPESPIRFLALGDSYTIGQSVPMALRWPVQLMDSLQTRGYVNDTLRIIATTGWRTDNLINAVRNKNLEDEDYNLVSLLIGVNNQYQSRPFSQYVTEFPALLDSAIRYAGGDKSHVFVVSIPDYAFTPFGQQSSNPDEISMELDQYNAYAKYIADSSDVLFIDITPISRQGLNIPSYVANDGLHPSGVQYTEWVKKILFEIENAPTGIRDESSAISFVVSLSPNPGNDLISLTIESNVSSTHTHLQVYDMTGMMVLEKLLFENSSVLSTSSLPNGLYIIRAVSGKNQVVQKLVIHR